MPRRVHANKEFDLGIVGGGQLARTTAERASKLGLRTLILDPDADCPARAASDGLVVAAFDDADGLYDIVERSRVTTLDIESPDARVLADLQRQGHRILPDPSVLATIQDKLHQRRFFADRGFPVPRFEALDRPGPERVRSFGLPAVQKARRGGYDGRGVAVLRTPDDLGEMLPVPSVLEEFVPFDMEVAVLVARSRSGETRSYPAVEMIFDPQRNLIDGLLFPARLAESTVVRARRLATRCVQSLGGVGIFAVELFVGRAGELWINEVAPRPHNSGHVTIEAAVTCQFEQHVRAVLGMPLGETSLVQPAAMVNLTGPADGEGPAVLPGRKMGHITVLDNDPLAALERARTARRLLDLRARTAA